MNAYRGQRSNKSNRSGRGGYNNASGVPKRLLPEKLSDVFRLELNRLNNNREIVGDNALLFDSDITNTDDGSSGTRNKYPLQSIYIGEIWRFRVKISNKIKEHLHNFGLLCHIETNLKGNGNPKQLYPRPRELCPTQMSRSDNVSLDLEYPFTSNEPCSYSLIFTVTASNEDDMQRLYKQIFEFSAVPALSLTFQKQTLDENLFVEALINNVSNQPTLPLFVTVNFKCLGLFKSYNLTNYNSADHQSESIYLEPRRETNILFQIEMKNPTSLVNLNALSVGQIEIKWHCAASDREGLFLSDIIQRRSLFCRKLDDSNSNSKMSENIEILILKCPSQSIVHKPFTVQFHIFNLDRYSHKIWLSIDKNLSGYLLPCNISKKYLGILEPSSSMKTQMSLIAFAPGIHVLTGIVIMTQKMNANQSGHSKKTTHYESQQYIYIDIDPQFHHQKIREKAMKHRSESETEQKMEIETQTRHRGSIVELEHKIDMSEQKSKDMRESEMESEHEMGIEPSPKHKPMIPPSSGLKPIGHQKSESEILKEEIEEKKCEMKSLKPLTSMDTDTDMDMSAAEESNHIPKKALDIKADVLDAKPFEVGTAEVADTAEPEPEMKIRDLGALDPNSSAISVAVSGSTPNPVNPVQETEKNVNDINDTDSVIDENVETDNQL